MPEAFMEACKAALGEPIHMLKAPERPRKAGADAHP
jgi:dihydrolipoamide dehydrogenase